MTPDEAMRRLAFHTEPQHDSFLEMLRPYRGVREEVLSDVGNALRACAPLLASDRVPRELVSALWTLSHLGRSWALEAEGMLRRNQLITDADLERLADFLSRFEYAVMMLLEDQPEEAFADWPE